jgi:dihydroorotase
MADLSMLLLVHGEVTDADVDVFDREAVFIERILVHVVRDFPTVRLAAPPLLHLTSPHCATPPKRSDVTDGS